MIFRGLIWRGWNIMENCDWKKEDVIRFLHAFGYANIMGREYVLGWSSLIAGESREKRRITGDGIWP